MEKALKSLTEGHGSRRVYDAAWKVPSPHPVTMAVADTFVLGSAVHILVHMLCPVPGCLLPCFVLEDVRVRPPVRPACASVRHSRRTRHTRVFDLQTTMKAVLLCDQAFTLSKTTEAQSL